MKTNSIVAALLIGTGLVATACIADPGAVEEDGAEELVGEAEGALQIAWPVAAWHFDVNCSGATAFDSSGNDLHGVRSGGVNCAAGAKGGKSLEFNGTNGKVEIPDHAALDFTTAMTVSACVKPQSTASGTILSKWYTLDSYQLGVSSGNVLFSVAFPGGSWGVTKDVTAPMTTGVWQHVAGVYDGANLLLYRNGALVASTPASGTLQPSSRPVVIGNHPSWSAFNGNIDHVYLYNRALTVAEIGTLKAECLN
ncbi:MAG TPA: LamG domain-containing protein [Polyangium sp.]|nr:LamG domain-containing protein [Polyangium sp.]